MTKKACQPLTSLLMVRSVAQQRVSNHAGSEFSAILRDALATFGLLKDEVECVARSFPRKRESSSALPCISWVPACAGRAENNGFPDSIVKQPSVIGRCFVRRRVRLSLFPFPHTEGAERRQTHRQGIRTAAERRAKPLGAGGVRDRHRWRTMPKTHAPNGAPLAAILGLGTVLPGAGHTRPRRLSLLLPHLVQPSKAAPPSWSGRRPLASRSMVASHTAGAAPAGTGEPVPAQLSCSANRTPHDGAPG